MFGRLVSIALVMLALPAFAADDPLLGTWKSDRALTLARLETDGVRPEHQKVIREEGDLGNAIVSFRDGEYSWTLHEKSWRLPYRVRSVEAGYVEIEYFRSPIATTPKKMRVFVSGDLMYVPIPEFSFYEIFRRLPEPASAP